MARFTVRTPSLPTWPSVSVSRGPLLLIQMTFFATCASGHMMPRSVMLPPGTSDAISSIFMGRCHDYLNCTLAHPSQCESDPYRFDVNCTESLHAFLNAFSQVDPCNVSDDAYDLLLGAAMVHSQKDETLFWSGTGEIAINIATVTDRFTTIERTLAGYILNGLQWCGAAPGTAHGGSSCPTCESGAPGATYQFWRAASRHFAAQARGSVSLLLDSTRDGGAFRASSTFATEELPNINMEQVSHVNIHLVRNVNVPANVTGEDCNTGTVLKLRSIIEQKGLNYTCTEEDSEFVIIQCVEYPDVLPCQRYRSSSVLGSVPSLATTLLVGMLCRLMQSFS